MALLTAIGSLTWCERGTEAALALYPFTPVDLGLAGQWLAAPPVARWWLTGPGGRAERIERAVSEIALAMEEPDAAPFTIRRDDRRIGYLQLWHANPDSGWNGFAWPTETVGVDLFIGEPTLLNKGLGRRALNLAAEAAFSDQAVTCLGADPATANAAATACFRAAGFADWMTAIRPGGPARLMRRFKMRA